ncbi:MAG: AI-2E family transporter [Limnothrix sp. RL_2_0]|nr:AI-2E family transporter [Limnothrix sp. RL_2_0]
MAKWFDKLPHWLVLEIVIPLTILNLWLLGLCFHYFQSFITLLIVAALFSFFLDYPTRFLQEKGLKRETAVIAIIMVAIVVIGILGIVFAPVLIRQLQELINRLPNWLQASGQQLESIDNWLIAHQISLDLSTLSTQLAGLLPTELKVIPEQVLGFVLSFADSLLETGLTAVFTLYFLLHGAEFWGGFLQWFPGNIGTEVRRAARQQFQNYFVGQAIIATLMGVILSVAFFLLKIPFWLVFGLGIGVAVLIPFGDVVAIALVTVIISLKSLWLGGELLLVAIVTDQVIDTAIAPKLLGNLVGLNPIWVLISLLLGAQLGGLLGVVIAVPLAGTIKSLINSLRQGEKISVPKNAIIP